MACNLLKRALCFWWYSLYSADCAFVEISFCLSTVFMFLQHVAVSDYVNWFELRLSKTTFPQVKKEWLKCAFFKREVILMMCKKKLIK